MKPSMLLISLLWLSCQTATAASVQISEKLSVDFSQPAGWQLALEPPQVLIDEMAEHIAQKSSSKGYQPSQAQLLEAARKRLAINEVLLYNPVSKASFTIDFSRLRQGEKAPSEKAIELSAKYSGESLAGEEGVSNLHGQVSKTSIPGSSYSYKYDADYRQDQVQRHFSGIIGFIEPYWFYFYYNGPREDPLDRERAEAVFRSLRLRKD